MERGKVGVVWQKSCSRSVKEKSNSMIIKKITISSFYKRSDGNKKMTISRLYLHSENNTPGSLPPSSLSPSEGPIWVCYRVSIGLHLMPASVCVCVHRSVFLYVITHYGGPESSTQYNVKSFKSRWRKQEFDNMFRKFRNLSLWFGTHKVSD